MRNDEPRGIRSPVVCPETVDCNRDYSTLGLGDLLPLDDAQLAAIDPLAANLIVAREIASLAELDIRQYQRILNAWTEDFQRRWLPRWEPYFYETPQDFHHDLNFFRLGMVCQFLDLVIGVAYKPEQQHTNRVRYLDPADLFLNGVIDTRQGTCGNMAALHVAIGWRMGWPVSLACVGSHFICRFDNGEVQYNIEATQTGGGGWSSRTDQQYATEESLPPLALECGSDLRALRPREMLGTFISLRARHLQDLSRHLGDDELLDAAERDWLLARHLFPNSRSLFRQAFYSTLVRGGRLFEPDEDGHPLSFGDWLNESSCPERFTAVPTDEELTDQAILR